jgi:hypothetical protein
MNDKKTHIHDTNCNDPAHYQLVMGIVN